MRKKENEGAFDVTLVESEMTRTPVEGYLWSPVVLSTSIITEDPVPF